MKLSEEKKLEGEQTVERGETRPILPRKVHKMKRAVGMLETRPRINCAKSVL